MNTKQCLGIALLFTPAIVLSAMAIKQDGIVALKVIAGSIILIAVYFTGLYYLLEE